MESIDPLRIHHIVFRPYAVEIMAAAQVCPYQAEPLALCICPYICLLQAPEACVSVCIVGVSIAGGWKPERTASSPRWRGSAPGTRPGGFWASGVA